MRKPSLLVVLLIAAVAVGQKKKPAARPWNPGLTGAKGILPTGNYLPALAHLLGQQWQRRD